MMIRPAHADDYAAFCSLFRELGVDDPPPPLERWQRDFMPTTWVAQQHDRIVGYIDCYVLSTVGYVRNLVPASEARSAGVGAALMRAGADWLRAQHIATWNLNVKEDNAPAVHLYQKLGFRTVHRSTAFRVLWSATALLPSEAAMASGVEAAHADEIEARFDLLRGRVAVLLRRPTRVLVQLRAAPGALVGFAAFDPESPVANVFRVARPALAGTLFAALRPHAKHEHVLVLVENDDALAALVEGTGATIRHHLLQMSGAVP
jgi:GNAT superfamily N-acetyltransferase